MVEYFGSGLILDKETAREEDLQVHFFTKDFGRLTAKARGGRKINSKLSPHLEINTIASVRLVEKNNLLVADAMFLERAGLEWSVLRMIKELAGEGEKDESLWQKLIKENKLLREEGLEERRIMKHFGYDLEHANCGNCGRETVSGFGLDDHYFYCKGCLTSFQFEEDRVLYIR